MGGIFCNFTNVLFTITSLRCVLSVLTRVLRYFLGRRLVNAVAYRLLSRSLESTTQDINTI